MAFLALAVLLLAISGLSIGTSGATWCVCKEGSDAALQKALDYACGAGADCTPIHAAGVCYNPNTLRSHCSYAVNSYYQKNHQSGATCDFAGAATISSTDPSSTGCAYPSSSGTTVTTTPTPVTATPIAGTTPTTTVTPTTTSTTPYSATPIGGYGTGLGPTGINTDMSHGGLPLRSTLPLFFSLLFLGLILPFLN